MRYYILVFILYLFGGVKAQSPQTEMFGISLNSAHLVKLNYDGFQPDTITRSNIKGIDTSIFSLHKYRFIVYNAVNQHSYHPIIYKSRSFLNIRKVFISNDARYIYAAFSLQRYVILDVHTGKITKEFTNYKPAGEVKNTNPYINQLAVAFGNSSALIALPMSNGFHVYDLAAEKLKIVFESPFINSNDLDSMYFSNDDKYFVVKDKKSRYYIWHIQNEKVYRRYPAGILKFSGSNSIMHYKYQNAAFEISHSSLLSNDAGRKITSNELLSNCESEYKVLLPMSDLAQIDRVGGFFAVPLSNAKGVVAIMSGDIRGERLSIYPVELKEYTRFQILPSGNCNILYTSEWKTFNLGDQLNSMNRNILMPPYKTNKKLAASYQTKSRIQIHPNYYLIPEKDKANMGFYLFNIYTQKIFYYEGSIFTSFSSTDNDYVFFLNKNNEMNSIRLEEENSELKSFNLNAKFEKNDDSFTIDNDKLASGSLGIKKEIPFSYAIENNIPIKISLRSVHINNSKLTLDVQIVDSAGNYYYGAANEKYSSYFCNPLIRSNQGSYQSIKDFSMFEYPFSDSVASSIALVLDHSGSLGDKKAIELQDGTIQLINTKRLSDLLSIVKFDHFVGIESMAEKSSVTLRSRFKKEGLISYGGSTAILDAIHAGMYTLSLENDVWRKVVILFTDGYENASTISIFELVKKAKEENIQIFTIGYGYEIDEVYLTKIASLTGGKFYRSIDPNDIPTILSDVYSQVNHFYNTEIPLPGDGKHEIVFNFCPPSATKQSFKITFDNTADVNQVLRNQSINYYTEETVEANKIIVKKLESPKINFENPIIQRKSLPSIANSDKTFIETAFDSIRFPDIKFVFDKIDIVPGTDDGIDKIVAFLNQYPHIRILISGHTDQIGNDLYNKDLSSRRALAIKVYMVKMGIQSYRIETEGFGSHVPMTEGATDDGRQKNRRVEFKIID